MDEKDSYWIIVLREPHDDKQRKEQKRSAACSFSNYIHRGISCKGAMAFTYTLKCSNGSYYTGVTNDVQRRFWEHQIGKISGYTQSKQPVELAWCSDDVDITSAIAAEKQFKDWWNYQRPIEI